MPSAIQIKTHNLRVPDLAGLSDFYCRLLGMQLFEEGPDLLRLGFHPLNCHLVFRKAEIAPFVPSSEDFYWKIGITLPDLDAAVAFLRENGVDVSDPVQFRDIGYMSKITDPAGFIIELLQQGFEGNEKSVPEGRNEGNPDRHPVGAWATLAHITLRVTDIAAAKQFFGEKLGMRLMSVQPVDDFGFCLYFYSWSYEPLPDPDLTAIGNREWLWARSYTFIELQHLQAANATIHKTPADHAGFDGLAYGEPQAGDVNFVSVDDLEHLT